LKKALLLLALLSGTSQLFAGEVWQQLKGAPANAGVPALAPQRSLVYKLDVDALKQQLIALPANPNAAQDIQLPTPDGGTINLRAWQTPMMEEGLASRYPEIKTFTASAGKISAKIDITPAGFHAMVFDGTNTFFIDPYSGESNGYYIVYYKKDYKSDAERICKVKDEEHELIGGGIEVGRPGLPGLTYRTSGTLHRTYRLALACTEEYSAAVGGPTPTTQSVLAAMVTTMNRVNGVYERELAISMQLVADNDLLIYITAGSDPYSNGSASTMLNQNQTNINNVIGSLNYDIGHVFGTGSGGVASLASVCRSSNKARGVTGRNNPTGDPFDIDYVAHEMGHQFGAQHTFNANTGSCQDNGEQNVAYEPGSGSTIMAYAGICGSADNMQSNSDAYFHFASLNQILNNVESLTIASCPTTAATGNVPSVVPAIATAYTIPALTPFELIAPAATDIDNNELKYCWEQADLGDFEVSWNAAKLGPIFRSFTPVDSLVRVFPTLPKLLVGTTSYKGEKLADDSRAMSFKLTVRDILNGLGALNISDDEVDVDVFNTGAAFTVSTPATTDAWYAGSTMTVNWDVAGTAAAPINCSNVDIYLSVDGGYTYPYTLAQGVANDGSEDVIVPVVSSENARVKVKGSGNVFFNLNPGNFRVHAWSTSVTGVSSNDINIYPVPAHNILNIEMKNSAASQVQILNTLGQRVWSGEVLQSATVNINGWAPGLYSLRIIDAKTGITTKNFVVQ
jgi:Developmentally Regulated MAPK Interacting Protein.